jgi:hypothetical protein
MATSMHGNSIDGRRKVERKSAGNSLKLKGLEGQVGRSKRAQMFVEWETSARLAALEAHASARSDRFPSTNSVRNL